MEIQVNTKIPIKWLLLNRL